MSFSRALYFTALLPPEEIKKEILKIKLEIKEKYNVKHALKLPAHITILPPFWLETNRENEVFNDLSSATGDLSPFKVELQDFGRFGQRVIFIKVINPDPVKLLHKKVIKSSRNVPEDFKEQSLHPHITVATRDLTKKIFNEAWPDFQERSFHKSFLVHSLFLFRHNGKTWEIIREFPFSTSS